MRFLESSSKFNVSDMISTHFSCILSDEVMYVKFCQRLRELREERKLTQTALGAEIHIPHDDKLL